MAGLTHSSLVSLSERDGLPPPRITIPHLLGLAPNVKTLNVFALSSSAFFSISFLVWINSAQPFVLTELLHIPTTKVGDLTGTLILCDELLSLVLVFFWGALADMITVRPVASMGHLIIGVGLLLYPLAKSAFPGILIARLVFATGASALVTALGAALAGMAAVPSSPSSTPTPRSLDVEEDLTEEEDSTERTTLLPHSPTPADPHAPNPAHSARFAGILGFSTGSGALLAVFVFLRLPTLYSNLYPTPQDPPLALQRGLRNTFFLTAILAFLEGTFLFWGLKRRVMPKSEVAVATDEMEEGEKEGLWKKVKEAVKDLPKGVLLAREGEVALAYFSAFATRAQSVVVTAFIPLLINNYFLSHDRCGTPSSFLPSSDASETCHRAFTYSSTLTGIIQLLSLLLSPLIGYLSSHFPLPLLLFFTSSIGAISFLLFINLEDPENGWVWTAAVGMGVSQIGGIVGGLALVARCRTELVARGGGGGGGGGKGKEVGGAISGAYSAAGGLGILILGKLGGSLFDKWSRAPFLIVGIFDIVLALMSAIVYWRGYKKLDGKGKGKDT